MSILLPCPFCGSKAVRLHDERPGDEEIVAWVECLRCRATGPADKDSTEAVKKWNAATSAKG